MDFNLMPLILPPGNDPVGGSMECATEDIEIQDVYQRLVSRVLLLPRSHLVAGSFLPPVVHGGLGRLTSCRGRDWGSERRDQSTSWRSSTPLSCIGSDGFTARQS